jgi:hypothetical protein
MSKKWLMISAVALCPLVACSDDDDESTSPTGTTTSSLTGTWRVTGSLLTRPDVAEGGGPSGELQFLQFNADNTYAFLTSRDGFRGLDEGVFLVAGGQIDLGTEIYNYAIDGDDVTLSSPDRVITATLDATAPTAADWIVMAQVVMGMDAPFDEDSDLAWDGTSLWLGNGRASDAIYEIDPVNLTVLSTLTTNREGWGISWHDGDLWVSDNGSDSIHRLDLVTGDGVFASVEMGAWIPGIASDGDDLWCFSNNEDTIYQYDPVADAVVSTIQFDTFIGPDGMAFVDGKLYVVAFGHVHECELNPFQVVGAFGLDDRFIMGVTHDGTDFWVHVASDDGSAGRIEKIQL